VHVKIHKGFLPILISLPVPALLPLPALELDQESAPVPTPSFDFTQAEQMLEHVQALGVLLANMPIACE
jgi:hypothetical protein